MIIRHQKKLVPAIQRLTGIGSAIDSNACVGETEGYELLQNQNEFPPDGTWRGLGEGLSHQMARLEPLGGDRGGRSNQVLVNSKSACVV